jgi:hypothetical protein
MNQEAFNKFLSIRSNGLDPRLEVWYLTATDSQTKAGLWVHYELVTKPTKESYLDGWIAYFPQDQSPILARSGPITIELKNSEQKKALASNVKDNAMLSGGILNFDGTVFKGNLGKVAFNLSVSGEFDPLFTFAKWSWEKEVLPASQIVPIPIAQVKGNITISTDNLHQEVNFDGVGGLARIFGHGSAKRWNWLHANLDQDTVLEAVVAQPKTPGLSVMPPLGFVQIKTKDFTWPKDPVAASIFFKGHLGSEFWTLRGRVGRRRLTFEVAMPEDRCVKVGYVDPDSSTATCTNCEVSSLTAILERRYKRWETEKIWHLQNTAHAEYGDRP